MSECRLIQGWFALFIQGILGFFCILTLIIKRQTEVPRRDWIVWSFDALKQGIGSSFGHFTNIFLSVFFSIELITQTVDECQWYCLSYLVDSTAGIGLNLIFLTLLEKLNHNYLHITSLHFGNYGNPPSIKPFIFQLSAWLFIVIVIKIITYSAQLHYTHELGMIMKFLLGSLESDPKLELVVVMIIIPVTVNSLQFWLTDMFLKHEHVEIDASSNIMLLPMTNTTTTTTHTTKRHSHNNVQGLDNDDEDGDDIYNNTNNVLRRHSHKSHRTLHNSKYYTVSLDEDQDEENDLYPDPSEYDTIKRENNATSTTTTTTTTTKAGYVLSDHPAVTNHNRVTDSTSLLSSNIHGKPNVNSINTVKSNDSTTNINKYNNTNTNTTTTTMNPITSITTTILDKLKGSQDTLNTHLSEDDDEYSHASDHSSKAKLTQHTGTYTSSEPNWLQRPLQFLKSSISNPYTEQSTVITPFSSQQAHVVAQRRTNVSAEVKVEDRPNMIKRTTSNTDDTTISHSSTIKSHPTVPNPPKSQNAQNNRMLPTTLLSSLKFDMSDEVKKR